MSEQEYAQRDPVSGAAIFDNKDRIKESKRMDDMLKEQKSDKKTSKNLRKIVSRLNIDVEILKKEVSELKELINNIK